MTQLLQWMKLGKSRKTLAEAAAALDMSRELVCKRASYVGWALWVPTQCIISGDGYYEHWLQITSEVNCIVITLQYVDREDWNA